jgi:glycosyltransferase involved in cell wall biosynthesis
MRVLVITYTFPPSSHANAKRPYYLVKGMLEAGWEVDVIASKTGIETTGRELIDNPKFRIIRIADPVWSLAGMFGRGTRWEKAIGLAANGLLWPESCRWWALNVFSLLRNNPVHYDRVVALVFPPAVLLAAQETDLVDARWIFDFQESVSPQYAIYPRGSPWQRLLTPKLARLERLALQKAGAAIFTAATNQRAYIASGLVDANKCELIPHFYHSEVFAKPAQVVENFTIGYFGYFDLRGLRTPEIFLRALAGFLAKHPEARDRTRFVFYGKWLTVHDPFLDELGLRDVAEIHEPVPLDRYLELVKSQTVLLLLTAAKLNLFMPSKVVEYLGANRPILAFIPDDSEVAGVLRQARMSDFACGEHDVDGGIVAIERLWERYLSGELRTAGSSTANWSSAVQVPRYLELMKRMN